MIDSRTVRVVFGRHLVLELAHLALETS